MAGYLWPRGLSSKAPSTALPGSARALRKAPARALPAPPLARPVNVLQRRRDRLSVFPGDEIEAVAQQVNDTGLYRGLREDGGNCLGEALQAVDDGDQHVLDAPVFQLIHDAQPEFGGLVLCHAH